MKPHLVLRSLATILSAAFLSAAPVPPQPAAVRAAGTNATSHLLDAPARARVAETFLELVRIPGVSGEEQAIGRALSKRLATMGATNLPLRVVGSNSPANLALVLPATPGMESKPGILLNAHIDTIPVSTPDQMVFEQATGEFSHAQESDRTAPSSFGGDDRSGVAVVVTALEHLHEHHWKKGVPHRKFVILFTAQEERRLGGARYLARHQPDLFDGLEISLCIDGPLDLQTEYPRERLVAVVPKALEATEPYRHVLAHLDAFCTKAGIASRRTEIGLGSGDFAAFPATAKAQLHLRSPVRGWHTKERVQVQDLVHHTAFLTSLLLELDSPRP